jgi:hypothetical protein
MGRRPETIAAEEFVRLLHALPGTAARTPDAPRVRAGRATEGI